MQGLFILNIRRKSMSIRNRRLSQSSPTLSLALEKYLAEVSIGKKILHPREFYS